MADFYKLTVNGKDIEISISEEYFSAALSDEDIENALIPIVGHGTHKDWYIELIKLIKHLCVVSQSRGFAKAIYDIETQTKDKL